MGVTVHFRDRTQKHYPDAGDVRFRTGLSMFVVHTPGGQHYLPRRRVRHVLQQLPQPPSAWHAPSFQALVIFADGQDGQTLQNVRRYRWHDEAGLLEITADGLQAWFHLDDVYGFVGEQPRTDTRGPQ